MSKYRYEMGGVIRDTEIDFPYYTDEIIELLEEKDQQITDLQDQFAITKKALELACETLQDINFKLYNTEMNFVDFFKQQAKEMLENE